MLLTPEEFRSNFISGAVLYFKISHSDPEPHFHIVLNKRPLIEENLILVCPSHRIDHVRERGDRKRYKPGTLIIITRAEYPAFTCDESIVDCNSVIKEFTVNQLVAKSQSHNLNDKIHFKPPMNMAIIERLREAVCESYEVERIIQGRLC